MFDKDLPLFLVLDPSQKTEHIRKYWGSEMLESILKAVEETVGFLIYSQYHMLTIHCILSQYKDRYFEMHGNNLLLSQPRRTGKSATRKVGILIRELSSDDESDRDCMETGDSSINAVADDSAVPWHKDFNGYLNSKDQLGDLSIVEWWGVSVIPLLPYDNVEYCHLVECCSI